MPKPALSYKADFYQAKFSQKDNFIPDITRVGTNAKLGTEIVIQ
jgi:hypothetical protein